MVLLRFVVQERNKRYYSYKAYETILQQNYVHKGAKKGQVQSEREKSTLSHADKWKKMGSK